MTTLKATRIIAGTLVIIGTALAYWVSPWWHLLPAFVGFNLIQSSFTGYCPAGGVLRKFGIGKDGEKCCLR